MTDRPTDDPYTDMLALAGWEDVPHLRDKYLNDPAFYNALNLTAQLAARIRELEAERDEGWAKYQDGKYEIARLTALGNALADAESLTALAAAQHEWRKVR